MKFLRIYTYIFLLAFTQHITCMDNFRYKIACALFPELFVLSPELELDAIIPPRAPTPSASTQVKRAATSTIVAKKKPVRKKHKPELAETTPPRAPTPSTSTQVKRALTSQIVVKKSKKPKPTKVPTPSTSSQMPFTCTQCDYSTEYQRKFTQHRYSHAKTKIYTCFLCSYRSTWRQNTKRHEKIHAPEKLLKCDQCDYATNHKSHLTKHIGNKH